MTRADPSPCDPRTYREGVRILKALERSLRHLVRVRAELEAEVGRVPEKFAEQRAAINRVLLESHENASLFLRDRD